jgi:hypothetical protein
LSKSLYFQGFFAIFYKNSAGKAKEILKITKIAESLMIKGFAQTKLQKLKNCEKVKKLCKKRAERIENIRVPL